MEKANLRLMLVDNQDFATAVDSKTKFSVERMLNNDKSLSTFYEQSKKDGHVKKLVSEFSKLEAFDTDFFNLPKRTDHTRHPICANSTFIYHPSITERYADFSKLNSVASFRLTDAMHEIYRDNTSHYRGSGHVNEDLFLDTINSRDRVQSVLGFIKAKESERGSSMSLGELVDFTITMPDEHLDTYRDLKIGESILQEEKQKVFFLQALHEAIFERDGHRYNDAALGAYKRVYDTGGMRDIEASVQDKMKNFEVGEGLSQDRINQYQEVAHKRFAETLESLDSEAKFEEQFPELAESISQIKSMGLPGREVTNARILVNKMKRDGMLKVIGDDFVKRADVDLRKFTKELENSGLRDVASLDPDYGLHNSKPGMEFMLYCREKIKLSSEAFKEALQPYLFAHREDSEDIIIKKNFKPYLETLGDCTKLSKTVKDKNLDSLFNDQARIAQIEKAAKNYISDLDDFGKILRVMDLKRNRFVGPLSGVGKNMYYQVLRDAIEGIMDFKYSKPVQEVQKKPVIEDSFEPVSLTALVNAKDKDAIAAMFNELAMLEVSGADIAQKMIELGQKYLKDNQE